MGGLEAESVMFGMPVMLRIPDVIGVRLGALQEGVLATDLALTVTERLRQRGVSGEFVEFFGPGVSTLSAGERSVIANMAPEYGASTGYFPIDEQTIRYLRATGRGDDHVAFVRAYAEQQSLWFDPACRAALYGSRRDRHGQDRDEPCGPASPSGPALSRPGRRRSCALDEGPRRRIPGGRPDRAVAIAAITSCTNTSDPRLTIAAGSSPGKPGSSASSQPLG